MEDMKLTGPNVLPDDVVHGAYRFSDASLPPASDRPSLPLPTSPGRRPNASRSSARSHADSLLRPEQLPDVEPSRVGFILRWQRQPVPWPHMHGFRAA